MLKTYYNNIIHYKLIRLVCMNILVSSAVKCHPVAKFQNNLENENRYPNGTVIGKYTYLDAEGNPVNVKYYANDSSYGVELNSMKIIEFDTDPDNLNDNEKAINLKTPSPVSMTDNSGTTKGSKEKESLNEDLPRNQETEKANDAEEYLDKEPISQPGPYYDHQKLDHLTKKLRESHVPDHGIGPDYDTYLENDLKALEKCGKKKIRIYNFQKEKRLVRNINDEDDDVANFCEQF